MEEVKLKERLKIGPGDIEGGEILFLKDCLDQTELLIELPYALQKREVGVLARGGELTWVTEALFVIDRSCHYRLVGSLGQRGVQVRFRVFRLNEKAWSVLKGLIVEAGGES